ncbi:hypothetical protein CEUSTIGMA_g1836.t1 [Chlamydomonas eustigma]|uniref:Uncharacterized protein n=1 Tax=Chlamydomonas eustigma TaxID=1157962 RepID=A0A250WU95_9CHLO|nr:hypothetical protein CEUSTIGMA_g1836.t1 [Chlamydomonas eustigma]|eukprot:GAX74388.1 hypothetical protein CEUSTIGMA_g1836.t1 [Chlamydomonas eustigma]
MPPKTDLSSRFKLLTRLAQKALIKASSSIVNDGLQKNDPCIWMVCISSIDSVKEALKDIEAEQFGKRGPLQEVLSLASDVIQKILKGIATMKEPSVELTALQCKLFCSVGGLITLILSTGFLQPAYRSDWKVRLLEEGTGLHSMFRFIVDLKSRINAHLDSRNGMSCGAASSNFSPNSVTADMSPGSLLPFQHVDCTSLAFQIAMKLYLAMCSSPPLHRDSHAIIYKLLGSDTCIEAIKLLYAAFKTPRDEKDPSSMGKEVRVFVALSSSHSLIFMLEKVVSTQRYISQGSALIVYKLYHDLVSCWPSINDWLIVALSEEEEHERHVRHVADERTGSSSRSNGCQLPPQDELIIGGVNAMLNVLTVASPEVRNKYHFQMSFFALGILESCLLSSNTCWSKDLKGKPLEMRIALKKLALDFAQETLKTVPQGSMERVMLLP